MIAELIKLDWFLTHYINFKLSHPLLNDFFPIFTNLHIGKGLYSYIFFGLILLWIILKRGKALKIFLALAITLGASDFISYNFLKNNIKRVRPNNNMEIDTITRAYGPTSYSFPSNHAVNSMAAAVILSFFYYRLQYFFFIWAFLMAYSRVYVGVHFVGDVLAGLLIGFLFGKIFLFFVFKRFTFFLRAL